MPAEATMQHG
jgi:hypothetical protein